MLNEMTNLQSLLKDPSLLATQGYLAGEWMCGADTDTASSWAQVWDSVLSITL